MLDVQNINIEDFNYNLPDDRIAKFPLCERDKSKLLVWKNQEITESSFRNLSDFISGNALLVFNNTRVIQARLIFRRETGAKIEIFCLEPKEPSDYLQAFARKQSCIWLCLVGNLKRWKTEKLNCSVHGIQFTAEYIENQGEIHLIRFEWDNADWTFADILEKCGELPIPPYLNRQTEERDKKTYQTIYSKIEGSVAAPTAGLHFTEAVFGSLKEKHVEWEELTLHVGTGTFKPVKSAILAKHEMHAEYISVKKSTIKQLIKKEGRIFAIGTTSVRTLESLYYIGLSLEANPDISLKDLSVKQWTPYPDAGHHHLITATRSLENILDYMERKDLEMLNTHTQILIAPGYKFKIVNGMITNFHQPKSTLLLLISAFIGNDWHTIYDYALQNDFRFLSYGDSSLLIKEETEVF